MSGNTREQNRDSVNVEDNDGDGADADDAAIAPSPIDDAAALGLCDSAATQRRRAREIASLSA